MEAAARSRRNGGVDLWLARSLSIPPKLSPPGHSADACGLSRIRVSPKMLQQKNANGAGEIGFASLGVDLENE